jgi:hypothetical protein
MCPVQREGSLPDARGAGNNDDRCHSTTWPSRRTGWPGRDEARQRAHLSLAVNERAHVRWELAGRNRGRKRTRALRAVKVHPAGYIAGLHDIPLDQGMPDFAPCLSPALLPASCWIRQRPSAYERIGSGRPACSR